jgi:RNA polymerase sigma-70 factor (ECF subfamily)
MGMLDSDHKYDDFMRLYAEIYSRLYGFVRAIHNVPHEVEDIVQDVSVVAWKNFDGFEPGSNFTAWIFTIARNHVRNLYRKSATRSQWLSEAIIENLAEIMSEERCASDVRLSALEACLDKLRDKEKQLLQHKYIEGMTVNEIAAHNIWGGKAAIFKRLQRLRGWMINCIEFQMAKPEQAF